MCLMASVRFVINNACYSNGCLRVKVTDNFIVSFHIIIPHNNTKTSNESMYRLFHLVHVLQQSLSISTIPFSHH